VHFGKKMSKLGLPSTCPRTYEEISKPQISYVGLRNRYILATLLHVAHL